MAALALPVADREVHELKLRDVAKVGNRKHRLKHRLQPGVVALTGQAVHLQETLVRALLDFNQVGNLDGGWNLGKIKTFTDTVLFRHSEYSQTFLRAAWGLHSPRNSGHSGDALVQDPEQKEQSKHTSAPAWTACPSGAVGS